ncbi:MAG: FGGY family carbohydrate kinase, partial [Clostridia bacterium]
MSNIYVVDIGTQSMRGIIFNDKGELLYKEQVKYRPYLSKANGYVEQDPRMYWEVLCQITQAIKAKEPKLLAEVVAMSVDTFRDTAVFLDKDMNVLRNSILWSDQRMAKCSNPLPFVNRTLFRLVGMSNTVSAIRRKVKTTWVRENEPEIWAKTYKLPHISGYINYLLTGRLVESVGNLIGHLPINSKK